MPTIRKACNGACVQCESEARKARSSTIDPTKEKARRDAWREANRAKHLAGKALYREAHKADIKASEERRLALRAQGLAMADVCRAWKRRKAREEKAHARANDSIASRKEPQAHRLAFAHVAHMLTINPSDKAKPFTAREIYDRLKKGRRRAQRLGLPSTLTVEELSRVGDWQGWRCAHCGCATRLEIDHIIPLSYGGGHTQDNVQFLCSFHNAGKRDMDESEYRALAGIPIATPWDVY